MIVLKYTTWLALKPFDKCSFVGSPIKAMRENHRYSRDLPRLRSRRISNLNHQSMRVSYPGAMDRCRSALHKKSKTREA